MFGFSSKKTAKKSSKVVTSPIKNASSLAKKSAKKTIKKVAKKAVKKVVRQAAPKEIAVGSIIGNYQLIKQLGKGAYSRVFLGKNLESSKSLTHQKVAVKVFDPDIADVTTTRRFNKEAKLLMKLNHPGLVKVIDSGKLGKFMYLIMALVDGWTLEEYFKSHSLSNKEKISYLLQILPALKALHINGVIHRDIKPSNIMVNKSKEVILGDCGLAKEYDSPDATQLTLQNQIVGTPYYMSFEQASGAPLDPRSDLASVGVCLWEAVLGRHPYLSSKRKIDFGEIMSREASFSFSEKIKLSSALRDVLMKSIHRDRRQRFQDCDEMLKAFEKWK